jgi:leucyl aminopeptidase (aminopeptidase T)
VFEYGVRNYHIDPPHFLGLSTAARADCESIASIAQHVLEEFGSETTLRISNANGTEVIYRTALNRMNIHDHFPSSYAMIPIGSFVPHPFPDSVNGVMVFDALDGVAGVAGVPIEVTVENGIITNVVGGVEADYLQEMFQRFKGTNTIGEIGFGINPYVPLMRCINEKWHEVANRSAGVVHAGIGSRFSETTQFHCHLLMMKPTVQIAETGHRIIEQGRLLVLDDPIFGERIDSKWEG